ncbi:MAG: hypothetical protein IJB74_03030 [Clostridia bacterium]|nr:hypothetical protein [Clostridia bacterium]
MKQEKKLTFVLHGEQYLKFKEFEKLHRKTCSKKYSDSVGTLFSFEFIPTGLGCLKFVKCPCGAELDVSDSLFD